MRALAVVFALWASAAGAVLPDEVLEDPQLEERARALSQGLRCLVCQNESIDESNAELARDLRLYVRELLVAGESDEGVLDAVVARYGEYVLLNPRMEGSTWVLWLSGPALLLAGLGTAFVYTRRRGQAAPEAGLSAEEKARIDELMGS